MKTNRRRWLGAALASAVAVPVRAERIHALRLKFDVEAKVPLAGLLAPANIVFPLEVAGGLAAGALEIRVRQRFPVNERDTLAIQVFIVPPSTPYPMPTPPAETDPATVAYFEVEVYDVQTTDRPNAAVSLVGPVVRTPGSPFGDLTGVLSYVNFQYIPGSPTRFRGVFGGSVGVITTNAPSGVGTLEWNYRMP